MEGKARAEGLDSSPVPALVEVFLRCYLRNPFMWFLFSQP